ncbi:hypothetical protein NKJ59_31365 [Mesorhizobium australicum]|uniref:hypothetical protein n=1 Tax=Mesorhizobium australicum TaxID=536018 RepID=UPI003338C370
MGYRNSALYTLKYVAEMLEEDEDFLRDCSIEMFSEDGCLSASELSEPIVVFTEDGIDPSADRRRAQGCGPRTAQTYRRKPSPEIIATAALAEWLRFWSG